jgi:hypothetical protein
MISEKNTIPTGLFGFTGQVRQGTRGDFIAKIG